MYPCFAILSLRVHYLAAPQKPNVVRCTTTLLHPFSFHFYEHETVRRPQRARRVPFRSPGIPPNHAAEHDSHLLRTLGTRLLHVPLFCTPVSGFRNRVILWFLSALHCVPTHTLSLFSRRRPRPTVPFLCMAIGPRSAMVDQCPNAPVSSAIDHSLSLLSSLDPKSSSTKKLLRSERAAMTSCRLHITAATQDSLMPGNCYNEYKRIPARESCQCAAAFRPLMPLMSKFMSSFLLPRRSRVLSTWPSRAPLIPRLAAHCPRSRVAVCATSASDRTAGLLSPLQRHRAQHNTRVPLLVI
jgi:hypothetical protein